MLSNRSAVRGAYPRAQGLSPGECCGAAMGEHLHTHSWVAPGLTEEVVGVGMSSCLLDVPKARSGGLHPPHCSSAFPYPQTLPAHTSHTLRREDTLVSISGWFEHVLSLLSVSQLSWAGRCLPAHPLCPILLGTGGSRADAGLGLLAHGCQNWTREGKSAISSKGGDSPQHSQPQEQLSRSLS